MLAIQSNETNVQHFFDCDDFELDSGVRVGNIQLAYETFGTLNSAKSNAILICHSLSADTHVCTKDNENDEGWWDLIVGGGKSIDTSKFFIICVNNLGGCFGSTGPKTINPDTKMRYGDSFPRLTINDIVRAQKLVIDKLGINQLYAVVGSSLGGIVALQWASSFPDIVQRLISISSCAQVPSNVLAIHQLQLSILEQSACTCRLGEPCQIRCGFSISRIVGLTSYLHPDYVNQRFKLSPPDVLSYLDYHADKFKKAFNCTSYKLFLDAADTFTIESTNHYSHIKAKTLIISVDTDLLFRPQAQHDLYHSIKLHNPHTYLVEHCSLYGHDAFMKDKEIGNHIEGFLLNKNQEPLLFDHGLLSVIGDTPIVRLDKIQRHYNLNFKLYAKLENMNPGGSIKDRPAKNIILSALQKGLINKDSTIIEYSSGNMGIGLAQICLYLGLRFICVTDTRINPENLRIMKTYGAQIKMIRKPDPATNEFLPAAYQKIQYLLSKTPNLFWVNQHNNLENARAHSTTIQEIYNILPALDFLFCATSTCGTLRGCSEFIRQHKLNTKIIAVDALGSLIFSSTQSKRIIPGHGAGLVPEILKKEYIDDVLFINPKNSIDAARELLKHEAILAGGSSGAVLSAILQYRNNIPANSICLMIIPDRGERYLNTIYDDSWCKKKLASLIETDSPQIAHSFQNVNSNL